MPITRPDGRHWCDPASEQPDDDGRWTCPDCGQEWRKDHDEVWRREEEPPPVAAPDDVVSDEEDN